MKNITCFILICTAAIVNAQTDILDARTNYNTGEEVTITGICINGDEMGSTVRYIQDESAGIAVFPGGSDWGSFDEPALGDEVTVTGVLSEYNGLLEIGPEISSVTINSSGNTLPESQIVFPDDLNENVEGELVTIEAAQFINGGAIIAGNQTYSFEANGESGVIYVRNNSVLVGTILPASVVTITGINSQFDSTDPYDSGYQLLPRNSSDFLLESSINIIGQVHQASINYNSFELYWSTDTPGDSKLIWGTTEALGNESYNSQITTSHTVTIAGLAPGTIYWAKAVSANDEDTTMSNPLPYGTRSESSGYIIPYFTQSVDNTVATGENAVALFGALNDTIKAYIDRVDSTLDVAMYNFGDPLLRQALNDAYDRGVRIRVVVQGTNTNAEIDNLDPNIPVLMRTDENGSGMHNKFMICDANLTDQAVVMGGSMNWIDQDENDDYNNVIFIYDQTLARGYEMEFEEMWGSEGALPDETNSRFGADKVLNTPRKYIIGFSPVEVYFSPSDNTNQRIIETIQTTDESLDYAIFAFTRDDIAQAIVDEDALFLTDIRGLIDQTSDPNCEYQFLLDNDMDVYSYQAPPGLLHHKYCIVDAVNENSDPTVLTGSHNWSTSANTLNDENTLVIHDARVANLYYQEFTARWLNVGVNELQETGTIEFSPNPASSWILLNIPSGYHQAEFSIRDLHGNTVEQQIILEGRSYVDVSTLAPGMYVMKLVSGKNAISSKLVIR